MALNKEQAAALSNSGFFHLVPESFSTRFSTRSIDSIVDFYAQIGLLAHLSQAEIDSCVQVMQDENLETYNDLLVLVKDLVVGFEWEYGIDPSLYRDLTKRFAKISKGKFSPQNIIDTYDFDKRKVFTYGFTLNGKKYSTKLSQKDDWIDPGFWQLIQKAVKEQDKEGAFYSIPNRFSEEAIIYLTHTQAKALMAKKLISFGEEE
jgi:hypothetical protein